MGHSIIKSLTQPISVKSFAINMINFLSETNFPNKFNSLRASTMKCMNSIYLSVFNIANDNERISVFSFLIM